MDGEGLSRGIVRIASKVWALLPFVSPMVWAGTALATVSFSWVTVSNPGNAADPSTGSIYGSVGYTYQISKYDVTDGQYADFLNTVDPTGSNTLDLYNTYMTSEANGGINYDASAADGDKYDVKTGQGNQPVVDESWYSAARFVNWLRNGQGAGGTESGVYNMSQIYPTRAPDATIFIPNENEWYKAAYYDPTLNNGSGGYWTYATRSNAAPTSEAPPGGSNSANYYGSNGFAVTDSLGFNSSQDYLTDVGAYSASASYYGTFDQSGDVWQWSETFTSGGLQIIQGGGWAKAAPDLTSSGYSYVDDLTPFVPDDSIGFRVASLPEPSGIAIVVIGLSALLGQRTRFFGTSNEIT
jgi:formylglycine-generating enzyme